MVTHHGNEQTKGLLCSLFFRVHRYPIVRLGANVYYSNVSAALETTLLEQGAHTLAQTREILLKNTKWYNT